MFKDAIVMYRSPNMRALTLLATFLLVSPLLSASAEDPAQSAMVRIRSVLAYHGDGEAQSIDPSIKDLEIQLQRLPFTKFQLAEDRRELLSMKSKELIRLSTGDKLSVRPLYMQEGKLCIWLRWVGADGMQVLDTRLHIEPGSSILAGTESSEKRATVLAIGVLPQ